MTDLGTSGNVYPFPHGPESARPNWHEQYTLVESRFTVRTAVLWIQDCNMEVQDCNMEVQTGIWRSRLVDGGPDWLMEVQG